MSIRQTLRRGFLTGLLLVAPLAVTVLVGVVVWGWLVGFIHPFLALFLPDAGLVAELVAIVVLATLVTGLGIVVQRGVGEYAVDEFDHVMEAIPVVRAVYSSARQASNALAGQGNQFERVVLVEWPRTDLHTVAFVTNETPETVATEVDGDGECYNVFVPMSPNPMGGFLAVVPDSRLVHTDLSVREGLQMVVTTGLSGEDEFPFERFVED